MLQNTVPFRCRTSLREDCECFLWLVFAPYCASMWAFHQDFLKACPLCFFLRDLSSIIVYRLDPRRFYLWFGFVHDNTFIFVQDNSLQRSLLLVRDTGSLFCLKAFSGSLCLGKFWASSSDTWSPHVSQPTFSCLTSCLTFHRFQGCFPSMDLRHIVCSLACFSLFLLFPPLGTLSSFLHCCQLSLQALRGGALLLFCTLRG